ncbi:MAG: hypothetical protein U0223_04730 [Nitrospira sp.]|nr:hypothetical protein [Nitrospira sp.]
MTRWSIKSRSLCSPSFVGLAVMLLICGLPRPATSEWYAAGYGGVSIPFTLGTVQLNQLGETLDTTLFAGGKNNPPTGTYSQQLHASDLNLKRSPLFGGRVGYFFADQGFKWLGAEFEVFTTRPTIKGQTVSTIHDVTFNPFNPEAPGLCTPGTTCQVRQSISGTTSIQESSVRLITFAFNVVVRYPGKVFQPYAGVGGGAFYFSSAGAIRGHQVVPGLNAFGGMKVLILDDVGLFVEGKFNRATITNFDSVFGLSGEYSAFNVLAGLAYHF